MITGKIRLYEEPESKSYQGNTRYYNLDDDDYSGYSGWRRQTRTHDEMMKEYRLERAKCEQRGFEIGAKVKRKAGWGTVGTIIHIHESWVMGYNTSCDSLEILKVNWENSSTNTSGTYDYDPDALVLIEKKPEFPALLQLINNTKGTDNDETNLDLC